MTPTNEGLSARLRAVDVSLASEAADALDAKDKLLADAEKALADMGELSKLANTLTGCRGDDDYVWGIEARVAAALAKIREHLKP